MTEEKKPSKKTSQKKVEKKPSTEQKLKTEITELKNDLLHQRADFENFRKRIEKEREEIRDRAISSFVEDILPAIDNFEMSLKMTGNTDMFIKGVEMIHKNLIDTLKEYKIEHYEPIIGDVFDPMLHDPVLIEEKEKDSGKVLGIIKKGYKHKDKILRPAKVQVKKE